MPWQPGHIPDRKELQQRFRSSDSQFQLRQAEREALAHYNEALNQEPNFILHLNGQIALTATDVEILVADLEAQAFERLPDAGERETRLAWLDRQLGRIIKETSGDKVGTGIELEVMRIGRRLAQAADMDHLVRIRHGLPPEDLCPGQGSVDIEITIGGTRLPFQIKGHRSNVRGEAQRIQQQAWARALAADLGKTLLVKLEPRDVRTAHEACDGPLPRLRSTALTALRPLFHAVPSDPDRRQLLAGFGFDEQHLRWEDERFERLSALRREREEAARLARHREGVRTTFRASPDWLEEEDAHPQRIPEAVPTSGLPARSTARQRKTLPTEAEEPRMTKVETAPRPKRPRAPEREPPREIRWQAALQALGFLDAGWKPETGDSRAFIAAKRDFLALFGAEDQPDPRRLKLNDRFKRLFPTDGPLYAPTAEILATVDQLRNEETVL